MRNSRHSVSLRTFGLAFAVVLSPALFQTTTYCTPLPPGDTTLSELAVIVGGVEQIEFDANQHSYDVWLPLSADAVLVRAFPMDPLNRSLARHVDYQEPDRRAMSREWTTAAAFEKLEALADREREMSREHHALLQSLRRRAEHGFAAALPYAPEGVADLSDLGGLADSLMSS